MRPVYLDNNATTRVDPEVVAAMLPYLTEHFGNPSSPHAFGAPSRQAMKTARDQVAALVGADLRRRDPVHLRRNGERQHRDTRRSGREPGPQRSRRLRRRASGRAGAHQGARGGRPDQGSHHPRPGVRLSRPRTLSGRPVVARRARHDDVGQQRDRRDLPGRGSRRGGEGGRRGLPHGRGSGGRTRADQSQAQRDRSPVALRTQAARTQGRWSALRSARSQIRPHDSRRTSGTRAPRRHRERPRDRRSWQGGRDRRPAVARRRRPHARAARPARKRPRWAHPRRSSWSG